MKRETNSFAVIGSAGLPARYGGFETLVENLVFFHRNIGSKTEMTVYCSGALYKKREPQFETAHLRYIPLRANGKSAMFYDMWSILDAVFRGNRVILLLGYSASFLIPVLNVLTRTKFITNIDGVEWRRDKWSWGASMILRITEALAVKHSHVVIADNVAIRDYVADRFGEDSVVIAYGGDHALLAAPDEMAAAHLPASYALAICRIEPENNVALILDAFDSLGIPFVFVGNWENSEYGQQLKKRYCNHRTIIIHDPVYDPTELRSIRDKSIMYIHGHSAGGTNPSLVEMMHFGVPVFAYDCSFNFFTTEGQAFYFKDAAELRGAVQNLTSENASQNGAQMLEIAQRRYTWSQIGEDYFKLVKNALASAS